MRLLLYFLALLTGLSAAEAARPVDAASLASASLQLDFAEAVASNAAVVADGAGGIACDHQRPLFKIWHFVSIPSGTPASTPVSRAERAHK